MNSLDDFARLRPDPEPVTTDELDAIWAIATRAPVDGSGSDDAGDEATSHRPTPHQRSVRRVAIWGAAASLLVGVIAIASLSDRAEAPPAVSDSTVVEEDVQATISVAPVESADGVSTEAGEPPLWGITEPGWTLVEFDDRTDGPLDTVRLFAGPDGVATSWVAIVSGMSDPYLPAPGGQRSGVEGDDAISLQRFATEDLGSVALLGGGVSNEVAMDVFRSVLNGGEPSNGFVETSSASAAMRTVRYRFVDDTGQSIDVDVQGAGTPRFEVELGVATAAEPWDATAGVDDASIAYVGEYTLLLRNGFWVTRIVTSAPSDSPTTFTRLAELVQIADPDDWEAARPGE